MLSMFLSLPISLVVVLSRHYFNMLISVALMNSHNRFCKQSTVHHHPHSRGENGWQSSSLSFFSGLFLKGEQTLTINPSWLGCSWNSSAQLHRDRLKLWGSFNTTIMRIKSSEGSVTVPDSNHCTTVTPDLTVDCVFSCLVCDRKTRNTRKTRFCSLNSVGKIRN